MLGRDASRSTAEDQVRNHLSFRKRPASKVPDTSPEWITTFFKGWFVDSGGPGSVIEKASICLRRRTVCLPIVARLRKLAFQLLTCTFELTHCGDGLLTLIVRARPAVADKDVFLGEKLVEFVDVLEVW